VRQNLENPHALSAEQLDDWSADIVRAVRTPYLSIHVGDPGADYLGWLAALLPSAQVEMWPTRNHWLHLAEPTRLAQRVRKLVEDEGIPR
jgi:hypothetical protein